MTQTIAKEFPTIKYSFCIWHITSKFSGWFIAILRGIKIDTLEELEHQWPHMVAKHDLQNNKHIVGLYEIKYYWVPAYLRNYFF
ncbi:hypothetical protein RHMOL_Rhmol08G0203300 [Rhododendron molle]|uniref:Uncharacterized protein n=1 Tax=Rhododendron molle TaxID=49168 RepID=A0ACC0MSI8_RHOML|nr:hypothetical protein RHMOL_Rhmol08G0203300 [Rhododendron molle]